jgi:hypothetical protein
MSDKPTQGYCKHEVWVGRYSRCMLCLSEEGDALRDRMASMLRELEWSDTATGITTPACPICGAQNWRPNAPHAPDCRLAALLRELP